MIHVCLSLHDKNGTYSKFTGTTILSIFENTSAPVTVHILHDDTLTQDNRENFVYVAGRYSQSVKFYNVEKLCAEKISEMVKLAPEVDSWRLTRGAFYRLVIPQIFPPEIEKVIYFDSDIIVNLDIKELWKIELSEKILAATPEILSYKTVEQMNEFFRLCKDGVVRHEDYFNSGVLVMNLKLLRGEEETIIDGFIFRAKNPQYHDYFDQNVLNYCFSTKTLKLPAKFNRPTQVARFEKETLAKKIYHYSGGNFGLGLTLDMNDEFNRLWMKYFVKTPWFNEETIGRLYESFLQSQAKLKKSAMKLLAAMKNKERVFIVTKNELDALLENFSVRQDEEILVVEGTISMRGIIEAMKVFRGKKICFIMFGGFPFERLIKEGFVRGEDFVDCFEFSPKNFNSYPLVAAM